MVFSPEAVRGVSGWWGPFHPVADGEGSGLDYLLCGWGELQGGRELPSQLNECRRRFRFEK